MFSVSVDRFRLNKVIRKRVHNRYTSHAGEDRGIPDGLRHG